MEKTNVIEKLRNHDRQVTRERKYFIDLCKQADGHFTAADLLELDRENDNQLSRATVYNCLKVFLEVGFLRQLSGISSTDYYEIRHTFHPHARCQKCKRIIDIPLDLTEEIESWNLPFQLEDISMTLTGLCECCYSKPASF